MSLANALKKAASKTLSKLGGDVTNVNRSEVNDLIESQDKRLTISAGDLTFVPTTKDRVVISSVEFKIIQVVTNEQNNTAISFDLILR
jgi:hypothetical protein